MLNIFSGNNLVASNCRNSQLCMKVDEGSEKLLTVPQL